jgi:hypothetical protein
MKGESMLEILRDPPVDDQELNAPGVSTGSGTLAKLWRTVWLSSSCAMRDV